MKNYSYRNWKSTTDNIRDKIKKNKNFKTFETIVNKKKLLQNRRTILRHLLHKINEIKKVVLLSMKQRFKNIPDLPNEFLGVKRTIRDQKEIANPFNAFFLTIGTKLPSNVNIISTYWKFNDYQHNPIDHRFRFY